MSAGNVGGEILAGADQGFSFTPHLMENQWETMPPPLNSGFSFYMTGNFQNLSHHSRNSTRRNRSFVQVFSRRNLPDTTCCKTVNSEKNKALWASWKVKIGRWKWGLQADLHTRPLHPWLIITTLGESHGLLKGSQSHYGVLKTALKDHFLGYYINCS